MFAICTIAIPYVAYKIDVFDIGNILSGSISLIVGVLGFLGWKSNRNYDKYLIIHKEN